MSGDPAGAATGPPGHAEQASGQQASGHGAADEASGRREQGAAEQAAGRRDQGAAEQASAGMDAAQRDAWQPSPAGWELPWPESPASGTGPQQRAELEVAFAAAMRRTGSLMQLMGQAAAERIGINSTDLN